MCPRNTLASFPLLLLLLLLPPAAARAQALPSQRDMEKEQKFWQQLQATAPQALETFKRATEALDSNDYEEAARLYGEVSKAAPEFTPALRRAGLALAESGKRDAALPLLEKAATLERSPENFISLARVLGFADNVKDASQAEKERALALAVEADRMSDSEDADYPSVVAQLAMELDRVDAFKKAVATLERKFPDEVATHYFAAVDAATDEHWTRAEAEIARAEALGLPHEAAERFLDSGVRSRARVWRYVYWVLYAAAAWALGLVLLFVLGKVISNMTMRTVDSADPEELTSSGEKRQDKGTRILILGVGVLNGFSRNAFRAVLAHEYGHFSHRDTAGGEVALRVNKDMVTFAYAMAEAGQAVWYNLAFQFLRAYHFIFRRITHGATRLQEILADRVAAYLYGARAFEEGLTHVIYRDVEFNHLAVREIDAASKARRALQNIYELPEAKGGDAERDVDSAFREVFGRQTSEDDTHPAPSERFRLARRVKSKGEQPADGAVWELFADREALTREMSDLVSRNLQAA
jgi:Zn-dependent protease with chaperone function